MIRLLDLFCGAGGASEGYRRAGFIVEGVDINYQPRYPYTFHRMDALKYLSLYGHEFDVIHASPLCQGFSHLTPKSKRGNHKNYIPELREALNKLGKPYIIENVSGARWQLNNPIMLCGSMFGLKVWRHRYFETKPTLWFAPSSCCHDFKPVPVNSSSAQRTARLSEGSAAMDIGWMQREELRQSIPPAYTNWLGEQLLKSL